MQNPRLLFIDNLRVLLIAMVIVLHLAVTYGGVGSWYYREGGADTVSFVVLTWHNAVAQAFFMGLLFLIAGYFTPGSYDRKGPRRFLKERFLRLGVPMLCYDFVIEPLVMYPLFARYESGNSYLHSVRACYTSFNLGTGPLWFVETLLIFALLYALWRRLVPSQPRNILAFPSSKMLMLFAILTGIVTFIVRLRLPLGWAFGPLNLQLPFFPQYICLFVVGIVAYNNNWLTHIPDAVGRLWLIIAVIFAAIFFPALFALGGAVDGNVEAFRGGLHWQSLAYSLWEQALCVAMTVALLHLFGRRFNRESALAKTASDSSYATYIIHAPVIVLMAIAARNLHLYPLLKFAVAVLICVPLCFAIGSLIRKLPLARRIL